jgi:alpha-galactosidase/6-phospho-beta-glucosidase family protein
MNKNDVKFWAVFGLVLFVFCSLYFFPKEKESEIQQVYRMAERKKTIDSLQAIVDDYKKVEAEEIAKYFHNKYKDNYEEIDSNSYNADVVLVQQLISNGSRNPINP